MLFLLTQVTSVKFVTFINYYHSGQFDCARNGLDIWRIPSQICLHVGLGHRRRRRRSHREQGTKSKKRIFFVFSGKLQKITNVSGETKV